MSRRFFNARIPGKIFVGDELGNLGDPGGGVYDAI
jgi:hypothetical protein